ncbi:DASH family cryptochrome [Marinobacterium litorale]|uniref:DASH family cryptochrome n=1 Tax=Marinobacterium litorale TaxID=404770 RepID=UPI0004149BC4|nr:DASH family cryptochrome [Marinobacterium litorale]
MATTALYWLTHDLRLCDNPALRAAAASADQMLLVYCVDPSWFQPGQFQSRPMGQHRWRFIYQSLRELDHQLSALGQRLLIRFDDPETTIDQLIRKYRVDTLVRSHAVASDEQQQLEQIRERHPRLHIAQFWTHTLFSPDHLPFDLQHLPTTFTQFRKAVESLHISTPLAAPGQLPPPPIAVEPSHWNELPDATADITLFSGGESAAHARLEYYFADQLPAHYKQTRNSLSGGDTSTGLSPWLAHGCLSARQVIDRLKRYEQERVRNDSTEWISFELLWREYFQWYAQKFGVGLYRFRGITSKPPLTSFYPGRFRKWIEGETPYPIVNACMKQLASTGTLSNRGRQLAASCLVNELSLDWRYGASWFQQQLIDYDPACNWGNWQYIAGVGADPRGGRHFDLEWQTRQYDPLHQYIQHWAGNSELKLLDHVDYVDWPIVPEHHD